MLATFKSKCIKELLALVMIRIFIREFWYAFPRFLVFFKEYLIPTAPTCYRTAIPPDMTAGENTRG